MSLSYLFFLQQIIIGSPVNRFALNDEQTKSVRKKNNDNCIVFMIAELLFLECDLSP